VAKKIDKNIKRYRRMVTKINKLEPAMQKLADADFKKQTVVLSEALKNGKTFEDIIEEAYALVREAASRITGMRAYNVQLQGALAVHEQKIAEMKTGEGKTLTILFPAYLNALEGNGVHVVTANDYLAERDAKEMSKVYEMLGVSVGYVTSKTNPFDRQVAYSSDITYLTNNELGFDFLRDNMLYEAKNKRQRGLNFAIVDEADSVLVDEAQTPLVISNNKTDDGNTENVYLKLNSPIAQFQENIDYNMNSKKQTVSFTPAGLAKLEKTVGVQNLYEDGEVDYIYYATRLLKAYVLFKRDRDYIVDNGEVVIVDEFTGRLMYNHRYYQGVHQAIEAKEGLTIKSENKTLANITFQHLFKRYNRMAGLTGTAISAKKEFRMLFGKDVVEIPTNKPIKRVDREDKFFVNWEDKMKYLTWATQENYFKKGAILIGTRSVRKSADAYKHLLEANIPAQVLNAQHTKREAEIISAAGQAQTVTVATNMAGRGTDIKLADSVKAELGLTIFGTERHNARRIDNQLIGRGGRQGDPGESQFLISADDSLIQTYFKDEYLKVINNLGDTLKGVSNRKLQKISDMAQKKMENALFEQRVLSYEFDKVLDKQRRSFYRQRERVLSDRNFKSETLDLIHKEIYRIMLAKYKIGSKSFAESQARNISKEVSVLVANQKFNELLDNKMNKYFQEEKTVVTAVKDVIYGAIKEYYEYLESIIGEEKLRMTEKTVTLKVLDLLWVRHLEQVTEMQEAALVLSISQNGFFEDYRIRMAKLYQQMLLSTPRVITMTFFRTINKLINTNQEQTVIKNEQVDKWFEKQPLGQIENKQMPINGAQQSGNIAAPVVADGTQISE
jgi:preprotein translocase subunit SecA